MPRACLRRSLLAVVLVGSGPAIAHAAGNLTVVATNTILADMTREIAGDNVEVRSLVPAGVDVHAYAPNPTDVAALARAGLLVANGAGFEPWLTKLVASTGYSKRVVVASYGCKLIHRGGYDSHNHGDDARNDPGEADPHAWQDPSNGIRYVANIRDALCQVDPENAATYRARTRTYIARLEALDTWARRSLAAIPAAHRRIVTSHDSLAYFGRAYGIEIIALRGLTTNEEPDARQLAAIVETLRAQKARALFVESVSNPKMLEQLSHDTGASLGGELYTDSVGPAGSPAATYEGMVRENTRRIIEALTRRM